MAHSKGPASVLDRNVYTNGEYLRKNPLWFVDESAFKVRHLVRMIRKNHIEPQKVCEVGCGAGEVLRLLQAELNTDCEFYGYDISPQAIAMCRERANNRLQFRLADISQDRSAFFDLMLILDVVEHVEDYFGFHLI